MKQIFKAGFSQKKKKKKKKAMDKTVEKSANIFFDRSNPRRNNQIYAYNLNPNTDTPNFFFLGIIFCVKGLLILLCQVTVLLSLAENIK